MSVIKRNKQDHIWINYTNSVYLHNIKYKKIYKFPMRPYYIQKVANQNITSASSLQAGKLNQNKYDQGFKYKTNMYIK